MILDTTMSGFTVDYVWQLRRHSEHYRLAPPVYFRQGDTWGCHYMGNTAIMPNGNRTDVAHMMLIMATVNRPLPP
jgi:hypothetical protein